jgi:hypothetical protein
MESPPKPFSFRTKVLYCLILTGAMTVFGWFQLFRDEPPRHPPGLVLPEPLPPVADADNGLVYLADEMEKETWPEIESGAGGHTEIISWRSPWDEEKMQPLVEAAPAARSIIEKALTFPSWRSESGPGTRSFSQETQLAQKLIQAKIRHLAETGQVEEAMNWLEPLVRFAQRQEETPTSFSGALNGVGMTRVVDATMMRLISLPAKSGSLLDRAAKWLERPTLTSEDLVGGMIRDYFTWKAQRFDIRDDPDLKLGGLFGSIHHGTPERDDPPDWLIKSRFKPQAYHNLMLQHFGLMARLNQELGRERITLLKATKNNLEQDSQLSLWSLSPIRGSKILAGYNFSSQVFLILEFGTPTAYRDCCRTAIAAKRWSLAHGGQQVKTLNELVPQFLPDVPLDPYDNQPLKWDATTGTVYVIGPDDIDNLPDFKPGEVSAFGEKGVGVRLP